MAIRILLTMILLQVANCSFAASCKNKNNTADSVVYDLTTTLTAATNAIGQEFTQTKSQQLTVNAVCPSGSSPDHSTYRSYVTNYPVDFVEGDWKFIRIDPDYLQAAMQITDSAAGVFYPPENYLHMGLDSHVDQGQPFVVKDSNLTLKVRIARPFIGSVTIPQTPMFNVYVTTTPDDPLSNIVYTISYGGVITVPQNCVINAGQTLTVDFGKIYNNSFNTAGQKPSGFVEKTISVPVNCNGAGASPASFTLRLQGNTNSNQTNAIATDMTGIGVVLTDQNNRILNPNDMSSVVPFVTDPSGNASVTLKTYPVSTNGIPPDPGVFTALAFLRVDFP